MDSTAQHTSTAQMQSMPSVADSDAMHRMAVRALIPLLITYILSTLCLQGFNLVFTQVGQAVGAPEQASLITALPGIVLGIVLFIYGSLGDFLSLKRLLTVGMTIMAVGSLIGFIGNTMFTPQLWTVVIARMIQTAGEQVAGSVYLVIATKYAKPAYKVIFFGLFTAAYQFAASVGVFAAGLLSEVGWQYLFLIPLVTLLALPYLLHVLPDNTGIASHIDWLGFAIFGAAVALLTLFFSMWQWWMIVGSIVVFAVFGWYIAHAAEPFITPAFFANIKWLKAISLIVIFYFSNFLISPIINAIGVQFYHMSAAQVSHYLVWAFIVAGIFGTSSGKIVALIGRTASIIIAACAMMAGFIGLALSLGSSFFVLTVWACVFYAGVGLLYSPLIFTVLSTLPRSQSGRGVGMDDLMMNITASIGIAIFGGLMGSPALSGWSITHLQPAMASYSNVMLLAAAVILLGLLWYIGVRRTIAPQQDA